MSTRKRRGLGKGLDALLTSTEPAEATDREPTGGGDVRQVPPDIIRPNPYQPRQHVDEAALAELAASIRTHGLIQPLVVKANEDGDGYTLIAGERRWRASQAAGLQMVPIVVREATPQEMLALAIIENVQRADLNPIEAADGYQQLMESFGLTQTEVADLVGKSRPAVANTVRLLGLSPGVRALVSGGHLAEGHARALLGILDPDAQLALARRAIAGGWTARRVEAEVRGATSPAPEPPPAERAADPADPDTAAAVRALEEALGTRVEIRRKGPGGRLILHFFSEEELAALYDRLVDEA